VTKTQSAGPISCLEHRATTVGLLHCAIITRAAVLTFPLLLQTIISNQMRSRRLRGAWFSRLLRHPARRRSGSILRKKKLNYSNYQLADFHKFKHINIVLYETL